MSHLALTVPGFTAINGLFVAASVQLLSDVSQIPGKRPFFSSAFYMGGRRQEEEGNKQEVGQKKAEGH